PGEPLVGSTVVPLRNHSTTCPVLVLYQRRSLLQSLLKLWLRGRQSRPILPGAPNSVNQSARSGPAVMKVGRLLLVGMAYSLVITPSVRIRPILLPLCSVNQSAPSGPSVMPKGKLLLVGMMNVRSKSDADITTMVLLRCPVAQKLKSGPIATPAGLGTNRV